MAGERKNAINFLCKQNGKDKRAEYEKMTDEELVVVLKTRLGINDVEKVKE